MGQAQTVLDNPCHPYTQALVAAVPLMGGRFQRKRILLEGAVPNPIDLPPGCRFHARCPKAEKGCREQEPESALQGEGRQVACYLFQ